MHDGSTRCTALLPLMGATVSDEAYAAAVEQFWAACALHGRTDLPRSRLLLTDMKLLLLRLAHPLSFSADLIQGPGEYRLGMIDMLQEWNWKKRMERWYKIVFKGRCSSELRNGMSAVEPNEYARRFHLMVGVRVLGMSHAEVQEDWDDGSKERAQQRWGRVSRQASSTISVAASSVPTI